MRRGEGDFIPIAPDRAVRIDPRRIGFALEAFFAQARRDREPAIGRLMKDTQGALVGVLAGLMERHRRMRGHVASLAAARRQGAPQIRLMDHVAKDGRLLLGQNQLGRHKLREIVAKIGGVWSCAGFPS